MHGSYSELCLPVWSDHQGVFSAGFVEDLKDDVC